MSDEEAPVETAEPIEELPVQEEPAPEPLQDNASVKSDRASAAGGQRLTQSAPPQSGRQKTCGGGFEKSSTADSRRSSKSLSIDCCLTVQKSCTALNSLHLNAKYCNSKNKPQT